MDLLNVACPPPTLGSPAREGWCDPAPVIPPPEDCQMKVAQVQAMCRCGKPEFEDYDLPEHTLGEIDASQEPMWSVMCASCGTYGHVRPAELLGEPVGPLTDEELIELLWEREVLGERIREEELTRPYVWPCYMERRDALGAVERLDELEGALTRVEQRGQAAMPAQLRQRQELRARARELMDDRIIW